MPSTSPAQARLMAAVAHDPAVAQRVGIPQSVGREFNQADQGTGRLKVAMALLHRKHKGRVDLTSPHSR